MTKKLHPKQQINENQKRRPRMTVKNNNQKQITEIVILSSQKEISKLWSVPTPLYKWSSNYYSYFTRNVVYNA